MTRKEYWKSMIDKAPEDILAKDLHASWDKDSKSYMEHTQIDKEALIRIKGRDNVLDFGVGLGRNYLYLNGIFKSAKGYDLPEMIIKSRQMNYTESKNLTSSWSDLKDEKFDLTYAAICFQHMDLDELSSALYSISKNSKYLYVHTRSYNDVGRNWQKQTGGYNVLSLIDSTKLFKIVYCSIPIEEAMKLKDETHINVLYEII